MKDEIIQVIDAEIIASQPAHTAEKIQLSKGEYRALQYNKTGWLILLSGIGAAALIGSLLLLSTATQRNVANPSCQSHCYTEF